MFLAFCALSLICILRIWFIFTAILADHATKVVIGFFVDLKENFLIMVYNVYCVATFWLILSLN